MSENENKNTTYHISRNFFEGILKNFFGFKITGSENLPERGPFIVASNHVSYADPVVVGVACYTVPIIFMAKKELFQSPILGSWVKAVGCIPIERDSKSFTPLKRAIGKLREGKAVGIFPEGTRSRDGKMQKSQPGIGFLAAKCGVPIIPIYVSGTEKAMPRGQKFAVPCKIKARIGAPIYANECFANADNRQAYNVIGEKVMNSIGNLKNEEENNSII